MRGILTALLLLSSLAVAGDEPVIDYDSMMWADRHVRVLLQDLLGPEQLPGTWVYFRSGHAFRNEPEYVFQIVAQPEPPFQVRVIVREADGVSTRDQLMKLHRNRPAATAEELKGEIRIVRREATQAECPKLRVAYDEFSAREFPLPTRDLLILDGPHYEFDIQMYSGTAQFRFTESDHPMVKWALTVRDMLGDCLLGRSATNDGTAE